MSGPEAALDPVAEAKRIAWRGDAAARAAVAARPETPPELLYYLAGDTAAAVRAAVAANRATPARANRILAEDEDPRVRSVLARKIALLAPGLTGEEADRIRRLAFETLTLLVADAALAVRSALADALAAMPDAPRQVILALARDTEMPVAEPVIRLSPVLTEDDLLGLVGTPPVPATLTAVARRPGLSEAVSDALAATGDESAIGALLGNHSAAIQEATLDALIASAAGRTAWQAPLVRRPGLTPRAAAALAGFVAEQFLATLALRARLEPRLAETLRSAVTARLALPPADQACEEASAARAVAFVAIGQLGDAGLLAGAARGETAFLGAGLAAEAKVPPAQVARAVQLRSAKALVSLCWKARLEPATAAVLQSALGGLPPDQVLRPAPGGGWPLAPEEMRWQLDLLAGMAGR
jgi:uncharacterized protein (DUF2336 family)